MKTLLVLTLAFVASVWADETILDDMVIVEASDARVTREVDAEEEQSARKGRQFFWGMGPMYPGGFVMQRWYPVARVDHQMGSACYTGKGYMGTCVTPNACYGLLYALPKDLPSWALGTKDACIVQNAQPDSMGYTSSYGVCCSQPHSGSRRVVAPQRQYPAGTFPIGGQFGGYPGQYPGQYPVQGPYPGQFGQQPGQFGQPGGGWGQPGGGQFGQPGGGQFGQPGGGQFGQPGAQPAQPAPPVQQPAPPASGGAAIDVGGDDDYEEPASSSNDNGDYSRCGIGRNAIKYDENGEEVEQIKRITGKNPLRVAGGWPADRNEWPWVVMMMNRGRQFCDGSIIDEYHILTAAHCVAQMRASDVTSLIVRAGAHNLQNSARESGVQDVGVKLVVKHKDFTMETLHSDIAILVLKEPIKYTATVRAVCLPKGKDTYAGQKGTVVGWGLLRESGSRPTVLQELTMEIWDNARCSSTYGSTAPAGIKDTMLCAGKKGKDSCSGDSGGPFVKPVGNHWEQIGVVSWGIGCGKDIYPGVYTRVTHMMEWIDKVRGLYPN